MHWITILSILVILVQCNEGFLVRRTADSDIENTEVIQESDSAPYTPWAPESPVIASPVTASPVTASPVTASPVIASPVTASEFYCYTCDSDNTDCNTDKSVQSNECKSRCCYQLSIYGPDKKRKGERGCATDNMLTLNSCISFCVNYKNNTLDQICTTCETNKCNKDDLPKKFNCYSCEKNCNTVKPDGQEVTPSMECFSEQCCYTAHVQENNDTQSYAKRGCIPWVKNMTCSHQSTCALVIKEFKDRFRNGTVHTCQICDNKEDKCNNKKYEPPLVCYECKGRENCSLVDRDTPSKECKSGICYSATSFNNLGVFTNWRKCADLDNLPKNADNDLICDKGTINDDKFCDCYETVLQPKIPAKSLNCKSCNSYKCNTLELKSPFRCYQCKRCNTVDDRDLVDCIHPGCCYTAYMRDQKYEGWYMERGCAGSNTTNCTQACSDVENKHKEDYKDGEWKSCEVCTQYISGCNDKKYVPEYKCYSCTASTGDSCSQVIDTGAGMDTNKARCSDQCCLSLSTFGESGMVNVRKCAYENGKVGNCTGYCDEHKLKNKSDIPNEDVAYCATCDDYLCNREKLVEPFECYECTNCSTVHGQTPVVACRMPTCCYTAYVNDGPSVNEGAYYTKRGCIKLKDKAEWASCDDACRLADEEHYKKHPEGDVYDCVTCSEGAGSKCNNKSQQFAQQDIPLSTGPPSIMCYNCRDCNEVSLDTPKRWCAEDRCCYRAAVSDNYDQTLFAVRGCMKVRRTDSCDKTCEYVKKRHVQAHPNGAFHVCVHCDMGDKDGCNHAEFVLPKHVLPSYRKTHSIRCYKCKNCNKVVSVTPNTQCRFARCCYSAFMKDGGDNDAFYSVRGCAEWSPGSPCNDTCEMVRKHHLLRYKTGLVDHCETCKEEDGNECNRKVYTAVRKSPIVPSITCYDCKDCNDVTGVAGSEECHQSECCYRALVKKTPDQNLYAMRGCRTLRPGESCNNTCRYVEENYYNEHKNGLFHVCIQCRHNDVDNCNGKRFYAANEFTMDRRPPGAIMCYDCRNCSKVAPDTPTVECRSARCCYTAYLLNRPHEEFYAIRGCARWRRGRSCVDTCRDLESDHLWIHPYGSFVKCIPCHSKDLDKCNKYSIYFARSTTVATPEFTSMMCFECRDCYHVGNHTPTVECPAPRCCYTAHVKNYAEDMFYVIRGCGRWDRNNRCKRTCKDVRNDHVWINPLGVFVKCYTCHEGDTDECNNEYYEPPVTTSTLRPGPPLLMCYQCRHCNKVTAVTPKVRCQFPRCCYIVLVKDEPNDEIFAVRGCASTNQPCADTCKQIKREHLLQHRHGSFDYCMTCNIGESDECNRNNYNPPKISQITPTEDTDTNVLCYECDGKCNTVSSATPKYDCRHPKCCYTALKKNEYQEHPFAVRGCAPAGDDCLDTCANLKMRHKQLHSRSTLKFCITCDETEGDECNRNIYNPLATSRNPNRIWGAFHCFECSNCNEISPDTPKVGCGSECCFSKVVGGETSRGCAVQGCQGYCSKRSAERCYTCRTDKCNIARIKRDYQHSVAKRSSTIHCYECVNCYSAPDETNTTVPCPDKCCVMVWWTEHGDSTMVRMCAKLDGRPCANYCTHTRETIKQHDPKGVVHYCEDCTIDKCNYIEIYRPHVLVKERTSRTCYQCDNCTGTSDPTSPCVTGCCYSAVLEDQGKSTIVRACAIIQPGRSCFRYCEYLTAEHVRNHPGGRVHKCTSCNTDNCNTYCFECNERKMDQIAITVTPTKLSTHHPKRLKSLLDISDDTNRKSIDSVPKSPDGIPEVHDDSGKFKCYKCNNCSTIAPNSTTTDCRTNCCSILVKTVSGVTSSHRNCPQLRGIPCLKYCSHLATTVQIVYCEVCNINKCNRMPIIIAAPQPPKIVHPSINCYHCRNCNKISSRTPTKACDSLCCYATILHHDNGEVVTKRDCARVIPGRPCQLFCMAVRREHAASHPIGSEHFYCKVCTTNRCNYQLLKPAINPQPRRHPIRSATIKPTKHANGTSDNPDDGKIQLPIQCYNCYNCYNTTPQTPATYCPDNCCYTVAWTEYGETIAARLCADVYGRKCANYCDYLTNRLISSSQPSAMHYCRTCHTNNCNSEKVQKQHHAIARQPTIHCYECENCDEITSTTPTTQCTSGCCYSVLKHLNNGIRETTRQCAKIIPGRPCYKFCLHIKRVHMRTNPLGSVSYCEICTTAKCNNQQLDTSDTGVATKNNIKCYECVGCYSIKSEPWIKHKTCATDCCHTVVWTEFGDTIIARDCIEPGETPCSDYCDNIRRIVLSNDPHGVIHNCEVCRNDLCNNLKATKPRDESTTLKPILSCYNCTNCNELALGAPTIVCPVSCCYAIKETKAGVTRTERGCAKVMPGRSCEKICEFIIKKHAADDFTNMHCSKCMQDKCNSVNFDLLSSDEEHSN